MQFAEFFFFKEIGLLWFAMNCFIMSVVSICMCVYVCVYRLYNLQLIYMFCKFYAIQLFWAAM